MWFTLGKWFVSLLTGGSLEKILDVINTKMDNDTKREELKAWRDSERAKGNVTLKLSNGELMSISAEAYQNAVIRPS